MTKNYMADVAEMLGVELDEKFHIKSSDDWIYRLNLQGLETKCQGNKWLECNHLLPKLLNGELEIIKLPYKPKYDDKYYCVSVPQRCVRKCYWSNMTRDYAFYKLGMCYPTYEEAEAHFAEDYKKLTGKELGE